MIGIISSADELPVVEEFFQLFKTPWEPFRAGERYDVVLATTEPAPDVEAKLLIVASAEPNPIDPAANINIRSRRRNVFLRHENILVPVYGNALLFDAPRADAACVTDRSEIVGIKTSLNSGAVLRLGYDLFSEVRALLNEGQPERHARVPALDVHIAMLRNWIVQAGVQLIEIPAVPAGHPFAVCLTHDIDFIGIRQHRFDHTMWGFLYRSTAGALRNFVRGRSSVTRLLKAWSAAATLPMVYAGVARDFWEPFDWYLRVEKNLPSTYFLIPFKGRPGERVSAPHAGRRATGYDVSDPGVKAGTLLKEGHEIGVHGIDAWHDAGKGREELARVRSATNSGGAGIRMHWLLHDKDTWKLLEEAGYSYDSTSGYNGEVGYRNGTSQAFRPFGAKFLMELPMHIQDGAMFYPQKLNLTEPEASSICDALIANSRRFGGVLTVLWHDRSHGPERFWGGFYEELVAKLKSSGAWFASAGQAVAWFRKRRNVSFERDSSGTIRVKMDRNISDKLPSLIIRVHGPAGASVSRGTTDIAWTGEEPIEIARANGVGEEHAESRPA